MNDLHYSVSGTGPPLLLIHGTGGDAGSFAPVVGKLAARYRVIAYDRRGHGRSPGPPPSGRQAHAAHAEDARALVDALAPGEPVLVVGSSAGGIVALQLAATHPERVRALVVVEPPLWARRHGDVRMMLGMTRVLWHRARGRPRDAAAAFFRVVMRGRDGGGGFDALPAARREALLGNADAVLAEIGAGTGEQLTPAALGRIACPTTLLLGERSAPLFARLGRALAAAMPSLRTVTIAGAGHLVMVDAPDAFVAAVSAADTAPPSSPAAPAPRSRSPP